MLSCSLPSHAIDNAKERVSQWNGWSEKRIRSEIRKRLPSSRIIREDDEAYSRLEGGNIPCEKEMVCFMRDDVAIYVLRRNVFEKKFRVSTVYAASYCSDKIKLEMFLKHKGQTIDIIV